MRTEGNSFSWKTNERFCTFILLLSFSLAMAIFPSNGSKVDRFVWFIQPLLTLYSTLHDTHIEQNKTSWLEWNYCWRRKKLKDFPILEFRIVVQYPCFCQISYGWNPAKTSVIPIFPIFGENAKKTISFVKIFRWLQFLICSYQTLHSSKILRNADWQAQLI